MFEILKRLVRLIRIDVLIKNTIRHSSFLQFGIIIKNINIDRLNIRYYFKII